MKALFRELMGLRDIPVSGDMTAAELQARFERAVGAKIRVYRPTADWRIHTGPGARQAAPGSRLVELCGWNGAAVITIDDGDTVEAVERQFAKQLGIGIQIMRRNGKDFAPNHLKLKKVTSRGLSFKSVLKLALLVIVGLFCLNALGAPVGGIVKVLFFGLLHIFFG